MKTGQPGIPGRSELTLQIGGLPVGCWVVAVKVVKMQGGIAYMNGDSVQRTAGPAASRYRQWTRAGGVVHGAGWIAAWLAGGFIALAEGHAGLAMTGLIGGGLFAVITIVAARRHGLN